MSFQILVGAYFGCAAGNTIMETMGQLLPVAFRAGG